MRSILKSFIVVLLLFAMTGAKAQCSNFVNQYPSGTYNTSNTSWLYINGCIYGGEYSAYNVVQGATYIWTTCTASNFNTALTLYNNNHSTVLAYNVNACPSRAQITWTATFSGEVHMLVSQNGCITNTSCASMYWRMSVAPPAPSNNGACSALTLNSNADCHYQTLNNYGATNSGVANPGCGSYNGGDVWYKTVVPAGGSLDFRTSAGTMTDGAMAIYRGTCTGLILIACDDDSGPGYMPELHLSGLTPGATIFIRMFSYSNSQMGTFDLCIQIPCSSRPSNDTPCNAEPVTVGSPVVGTNACASATGQPSTPSCFTNGHTGAAWFSFRAPSSGNVFIETSLIGIASTQIALYSGSCTSLVELACNLDKGEGCGANDGSSSLYYSGLTRGNTYYVRVDGKYDDQGTFNLLIGNTLGIVPVPGLDCGSPLTICSSVVSVPDPGIQGTGNFCDFDGADNCTNGERNSTWYRIVIGANGNLNFVIRPNDASNNSCGAETDYDFVLWKISGTGATTDCGTMSVNSATGLLACNYDGKGVTGVAAGGNAPSPYNSCFNSSFEPTVPVNNGDVLLLVVQNFTGSTRGFTLDLSSSGTGVVSTPAPSMVYWNGENGSVWTQSNNWGSCGYTPDCTIDATIGGGSTHYPVISGNVNAGDLIILPGAKLTLLAGSSLTLCGSFLNFGRLIMDPGATLTLSGSSAGQNLQGNLAGLNAIGNLDISKTSGSVNLYSNIEILGSLRTLSATSVFNTRDNQVDLHKDFMNDNGSTTYAGATNFGELNFVGSTDQVFNQGSASLNLNKVTINKTSGNVILNSDLRLRPTNSILTLSRGKIITGSHMVIVRNPNPASVNEGNPTSYVEGVLRRFVNSTGMYDFPIGRSGMGYQRARINFTSNSITYLTAEFKAWAPIANPLFQTECLGIYDLYPLNHGYFDIAANANPSTAVYDMTLFNRGYTNESGALGWTIMKNSGAGWVLDGDCETSSAGQVTRTGMQGFSLFATAQSSTPLPIELLEFKGTAKPEGNLLSWITASELNNDFFSLQVSSDGNTFTEIGRVEGAGNSSSQLGYEYLHPIQDIGVLYYRLTQRDFDGTESSSDIIAVERQVIHSDELVVPKPSAGLIQVTVSSEKSHSWTVNDMTGRRVANGSVGSVPLIEIDLSALSEGVYSFSLEDQEGIPLHYERIMIER